MEIKLGERGGGKKWRRNHLLSWVASRRMTRLPERSRHAAWYDSLKSHTKACDTTQSLFGRAPAPPKTVLAPAPLVKWLI